MDVDGTLTDGKIYMGVDGEAMKTFDIKDGYALHTLLKEHGIIPVIITARKSPMVEHRCKELGVTEIHQGIMNKQDCLKGIIEKYASADQVAYSLANVAYIGDDMLDLQCMLPIKELGGLAGCPSNAVPEVLQVCDYTAPHKGGEGAVRDYVEYIIQQYNQKDALVEKSISERIYEAVEYISNLNHTCLNVGKYVVNDYFYYIVQEYETLDEEKSVWESHRQFIDIQWLVSGREMLYITDIQHLHTLDGYDVERDVIHYKKTSYQSSVILVPGSCVILLPKDAHRSAMLHGEKCVVKKIVGKMNLRS